MLINHFLLYGLMVYRNGTSCILDLPDIENIIPILSMAASLTSRSV